MKRYLLFAGYRYYPSGGWNDFVGSFDTEKEAFANKGKCDWYHIVDTQEWGVKHWYERPN